MCPFGCLTLVQSLCPHSHPHLQVGLSVPEFQAHQDS